MPSKILIAILAILLLAESAYIFLHRRPINRFKPVDQDGYVAFDTATGQLCRSYLSKAPEGTAKLAPTSSVSPQSQPHSVDPILDMIENGNADDQAKEKAEIEFVRSKRLRRGLPETSTPWMTVVGEVDDVKLESRDAETIPQVYQPVTQTVASEGVIASVGELSATDGWIVLRSRMAPEQMEDTLRATVRKIDPQLPLYQVQTMEHAISNSEAPRRFNTVLISSFATSAVLLSVLGIYAVIAFSVALREQEMAVRKS